MGVFRTGINRFATTCPDSIDRSFAFPLLTLEGSPNGLLDVFSAVSISLGIHDVFARKNASEKFDSIAVFVTIWDQVGSNSCAPRASQAFF